MRRFVLTTVIVAIALSLTSCGSDVTQIGVLTLDCTTPDYTYLRSYDEIFLIDSTKQDIIAVWHKNSKSAKFTKYEVPLNKIGVTDIGKSKAEYDSDTKKLQLKIYGKFTNQKGNGGYGEHGISQGLFEELIHRY